MATQSFTIKAQVLADLQKVWDYYTDPNHITKWNFAHESWCCPWAKNDLKVGGQYIARMEAVDGSAGFDFGATYDEIESLQKLAYTLGDGRKVEVLFHSVGAQTEVIVTFDAESKNSIDMQRSGWQAILNNFKKHVENCASASSMVLKYPISTDRLITLGKYSGEITYEVIHCDSGLNMAIKSESTVPDIKPCK